MCVIIYKPAGVKIPSAKVLELCYQANPHGAGLMVPHKAGNAVFIHKGAFSVKQWLKWVHTDVTEAAPAILHTRIATHGRVTPALCHPFPIVGDFEVMRKTVLFFKGPALAHNGILPCGNGGDQKVSDSMVLAKMLAETEIHNNLQTPCWLEVLKLLTHGSRIAIMWPGKKGQGEVKLVGQWNQFEGCFYSNMRWSEIKAPTPRVEISSDAAEEWDLPGSGYRAHVELTSGNKDQAKRTGRCPLCYRTMYKGRDGSLACASCQIVIE